MRKNVAFVAAGLILFPMLTRAQNFGGNPATSNWNQLNNESARIIYPLGLDSQARRIQRISALLDEQKTYRLGPVKKKWNILLQNQTTVSNAYVRMAPVMSELYLTPDQNNFSTGSLRWDDNLIIHENRHIHQFSNFNHGITKIFSTLLGQEGQLLANGITIPDYFFEGDAVWQETLVSQQGRGRMPSFYNGFKSLWLQEKQYSWMKLRSGSLKDYLPNHYEVGYLITAYGYEKYGQDFWGKVTLDAVRFKGILYAFNHAIEKHSGKSYKQFRQDALQYFKERVLPAGLTTNQPVFLTAAQKNNVTSSTFPSIVGKDTVVFSKSSFKEISSFYMLVNGKEKKLRVKDYAQDEYFSYRNGKLVYCAYRSDALRGNRDYSDIRLVDIRTNTQVKLTLKTKYFSPDINEAGTEIVAVAVDPKGTNALHRLDATTGKIVQAVPNPKNYFHTQTKYINDRSVLSAVRNADGQMALITVELATGATEIITPFSYNVLGYPFIKNDTAYYSMMEAGEKFSADKVFAVNINTKRNYLITENANGMYHPMIDEQGNLIVSTFTADGERLQQIPAAQLLWKEKSTVAGEGVNFSAKSQLRLPDLPPLKESTDSAEKYKKSSRLFNFHSARPYYSDTEYGYTLYGDNVLSTFSNAVSYTYNRNEQSSSLGYNLTFAGAFPFLTAGVEYTYNRNIDTALNKGIQFNSAKANAGFYVPLNFIGGRTFKSVNFGGGYNMEQVPYLGIGKDVLANNAFKYANAFVSLSNRSRKARQHINPRWAQAVALNYRQGFNYFKSKKLVGNSSLFFPGLFVNHSIVFNGAFQVRDTTPDLFSNNFAFARGYQALNTRRMLKVGANYHLPLLYPDLGFGNIVFLQRIRANSFYDYSISRARLNGSLKNIINRSVGTEIYFDGKIWNSLEASIGVRYSHLLDRDLLNRGAINRWEIILPINIIPD